MVKKYTIGENMYKMAAEHFELENEAEDFLIQHISNISK